MQPSIGELLRQLQQLATIVKKAPCHAALIWRRGQWPQRNVPTVNREAVRVRKLT